MTRKADERTRVNRAHLGHAKEDERIWYRKAKVARLKLVCRQPLSDIERRTWLAYKNAQLNLAVFRRIVERDRIHDRPRPAPVAKTARRPARTRARRSHRVAGATRPAQAGDSDGSEPPPPDSDPVTPSSTVRS
jgi:hypothetical protein